MGTVARMIPRPEDVEDVAQEVFLSVYFRRDRLRAPELFDLWLYRITVNEAYDYLRRRHCREPWISDLSEEQMVTAYAMAGRKVASDREYQKRIRETVDDLLAAIPEADRILLVLREIEGLSLSELGRVYHTNENVLKVRLFRARQRLLKAIHPLAAPASAADPGRPKWSLRR